MQQMQNYRVVWQQCPRVHHEKRVLFVDAGSADDAKAIARDHVERTYGIEWFTVWSAEEASARPAGRVTAG